MLEFVIAVSLAIIALFCLGAMWAVVLMIRSHHTPSDDEVSDRREEQTRMLVDALEPAIRSAINQAIDRHFKGGGI